MLKLLKYVSLLRELSIIHFSCPEISLSHGTIKGYGAVVGRNISPWLDFDHQYKREATYLIFYDSQVEGLNFELCIVIVEIYFYQTLIST